MTLTTGMSMHQYCSVCKASFDMSVVSEASDDGVIWLKCPQCAGILPHMPPAADDSTAGTGESAPTVEEIDIESARAYSADDTYEVGDVILHRGWNDYGTVVAKEILPGNRHMIRVRFVESGEVQLIQGGGA